MTAYNNLVIEVGGVMKKFSNDSGLNDFVKNNRHVYENYAKNHPQDVEQLRRTLGSLNGMNQQDIFNELMRVVQQQKRNGTFSMAYFENMRNVLFPYLSAEQQQIFENLLRSLR